MNLYREIADVLANMPNNWVCMYGDGYNNPTSIVNSSADGTVLREDIERRWRLYRCIHKVLCLLQEIRVCRLTSLVFSMV